MKPYHTIPIIATLALWACANAETNQQKIFAIQSQYNTGLTVAIAYKNLPECPQTLICRKAAIVKDLQDADDIAAPGLLSAQACVRSPTCKNADLAVVAANSAVAALTKITATLVVKEQQ